MPPTTRRHPWTTIGLGTAAILLTACGQAVSAPPKDSGASKTVEVVNCGRKQSYPGTAQRIVALVPGQADLVARLGHAKSLVGLAQTNGEELPDSVRDSGHEVPVLNPTTPPTREQLLQTRPDLVLSPTTYEFTAEKGYASQEQLAKSGAGTYVAAAGCLDRRSSAQVTDLLTDIDALGTILDAQTQAKDLRTKAEEQLQEAKDRARGKAAPSVAQLYIEGETITAIGAGVEHSIGLAAGGRPVFSPDDPAFKQFFAAEVNRETLLAKNPDVIVFSTTSQAHEKQTRAWLKQKLAGLEAVKQDRLVAIPASQLLPGTWGNLDAVSTINKALYPEA